MINDINGGVTFRAIELGTNYELSKMWCHVSSYEEIHFRRV